MFRLNYIFGVNTLAATAALLSANSAEAQIFAPVEARKEAALDGDVDGLTGLIGVIGGYEAGFAGGSEAETEIGPLLFGIYNDRFYLSADEAGVYLPVIDDKWRVKAGIGIESGRKNRDIDALAGLNDIEDTYVLAGGIIRQFGTSAIGVSFEQDLGGKGKGFVTFVGGSWDFHFWEDKITATIFGDVSWGTGEHLRTEFGITEAEALASQLNENPDYRYEAYQPGSGIKSVGGGLALRYRLSDDFLLLGVASSEFYGSKATNSPLLQATGAKTESEFLAGVAYTF